MSEDSGIMMLCCASCGIAEVDDIKLTKCDGCDLVKYCSDACQRDHKSEHEEACKKRAAELRDELLFRQPDSSHLGDCPICCLPMPLDRLKYTTGTCCSKVICNGCVYADCVTMMREGRLKDKCVFCRAPSGVTTVEQNKRRMKRVEANDPLAMRQKGDEEYQKGNYNAAFEYWTKAAELGDVDAHFKLACRYQDDVDAHFKLARRYQDGKGVEKDREKQIYHAEVAAIGGHPSARCFLGGYEYENGNTERAVIHWIIAATQGYDLAIKALMVMFKEGIVSKEDLAATLRAHQAAVDAMKSQHRDAVEELGLNIVE